MLKEPQERSVAELRELAGAMAWMRLFNQLSPIHRLLCAKVSASRTQMRSSKPLSGLAAHRLRTPEVPSALTAVAEMALANCGSLLHLLACFCPPSPFTL